MSYIHERKGVLNFVLLGAKSTAKTWYLKHLAKRKEISAIDEVTINYLDQIKDETQATSISYTELFFNYKNNEFNIEFQIDDYDGNFVETWHNSSINKEYKDKLTEYVKESEGIFIFLPYEDNHDNEKLAKMEKEIDFFIHKIKEEYGEEHNSLPIPIVFVVSKWDKSQYFKTENEIEKAKEYLASNKTLKLIQEKVMKHFGSSEVMPLSSEKDYNMLNPIQHILEVTFKKWEEEITQLQETNELEELLKFLKEKLYDIKFYKDGKYKKLYEEVEAEIAPLYLEKIQTIDNIVEFDSYLNEKRTILNALSNKNQDIIEDKKQELYEEIAPKYINHINSIDDIGDFDKYRSENMEILNELSDKNQDIIKAKKEQLKAKAKKKKILFSLVAAAVIGASLYGFTLYTASQKEEKLFKNIGIEYQHKNYIKTLADIEQYYQVFKSTQNKQHYDKLKLIEEEVKLKIREDIQSDFKNLENTHSLVKSWDMINKIKNTMATFKISGEFKSNVESGFSKLQALHENYTNAVNSIDGLSLETISKDNLDEIFILLNSFDTYSEAQKLRDKLSEKFQTIKMLALQTNEISEDDLNNLIEVASTMNISKEEIEELNIKLEQVRIENLFKEFIENLNNEDKLNDAISYIENHWDFKNFDENKKQRARQIINQKLNEKIKGILEDMPEKVKNVDDFNKLVDKLKIIYGYRDAIIKLPLEDKSPITPEVQTKLTEKYDLYKRYDKILTNGISTSRIKLIAQKNNKLNITKNDDEIKIYINSYYIAGGNNGFDGYSVTYSSHQRYKRATYTIKIEEIDFGGYANDRVQGNFTLTDNNLITLYNTGMLSYTWNNWGITIEILK